MKWVPRFWTCARQRPSASTSRIPLAFAVACVVSCTGRDSDLQELAQAKEASYGPYADDVARTVRRIYIPSMWDAIGSAPRVPAQLEAQRDRLGASFDIAPIAVGYNWLRDLAVFRADGRIVMQRLPSSNDRRLSQQVKGLLAYRDYVAVALSKPSWGTSAFLASLRPEVVQRLQQDLVSNITPRPKVEYTDAVIEGGNVLAGLRKDGTKYVLVGEDTILLTATNMNRQGKLSGRDMIRIAEDLRRRPETAETIRMLLPQLRNTAVLTRRLYGDPVRRTLPSIDNAISYLQLTDDEVRSIQRSKVNLLWMDLYHLDTTPLVPSTFDGYPERSTDPQLLTQETIAVGYLAKLELARREIARALGNVPDRHMLVVPQALYHLDVFLRPVRNGVVLMPQRGFPLGVEGRAEYNDEEMQSALNAVKAALTNFGLTAMEVPGAIRIGEDEKTLPRNFFNGILGGGDCGVAYLITNGSTDAGANDDFAAFMDDTFGIRTAFIERADEDKKNGGTRCATQDVSL